MRRIFVVGALALLSLGTGSLPAPPAQAAQAQAAQAVVLDCRRLIGTGRFTSPLRIGRITRTTVVKNCPPLSAGTFFNSRHFIFRLGRAASNQSLVGAAFVRRPGALGGVHPYLSTLDGFIFARSLSHGQTAHFAGGTELRHIRLPGVPRGTYILAVEFLDSPLRTVQTPPFDLWLVP